MVNVKYFVVVFSPTGLYFNTQIMILINYVDVTVL